MEVVDNSHKYNIPEDEPLYFRDVSHLTWHQIIKLYNVNITLEFADYILLERTAFPFGDKQYILNQIHFFFYPLSVYYYNSDYELMDNRIFSAIDLEKYLEEYGIVISGEEKQMYLQKYSSFNTRYR